ncbi:MAG TPA: histidine phosphatase family protein [Mycobacterium sp.]|nr:histidine phosphatase family protein [Mycobacterium sp.]
MIASPVTAWAADSITLTFVRHGQSQANAAGVIDTSVPGPDLTTLGEQQAQAVADELAADGVPYDGIYASSMVRTQETALPFATAIGKSKSDIVVLPGLDEINAGIYEGLSQNSSLALLYALPPLAWTLGLRFVPILGSSDYNGNEFEARTNAAIQTIYDSGDQYPVAFSSALAIETWTLMNVNNPDPLFIFTHSLGNTAIVVVTGDPTDGWTLQSWAGITVNPNTSLPTKFFVDFRTFIVAPQTALYNIRLALATGNIETIANAVRDGIVAVTKSTIAFPIAVIGNIIDAVRSVIPAQVDQTVPAKPTAVNAAVAKAGPILARAGPTPSAGARTTASASTKSETIGVTAFDARRGAKSGISTSIQSPGNVVTGGTNKIDRNGSGNVSGSSNPHRHAA